MSRIVLTEYAAEGMQRCWYFLAEKSPRAAIRAAQAIETTISLLERMPEMGRPFADTADLRELPIRFGESGYLALYRFEPGEDVVYILAFKHQREIDYHPTWDVA